MSALPRSTPVAPAFPRGWDPLRWWGRTAPAREALTDRVRGERLLWAELDRQADRWAGLLRSMEVAAGDRVAILAGNRAEHLVLLAACARLGATLVPLNWRLAPAELGPIVRDAAPRVTVGEGRFRLALEHADPAQRWVDLDLEAPALLARAVAHDPGHDPALDPHDAAMLLYTSGSTGTPKGAMIPHRQLVWNAIATTTAWELGADDVAPVTTPFFHTGGFNVFATPLWMRGARVVLFEPFDPATFLGALAEEGCTIALTVPTQLVMLQEHGSWGTPVPSLKRFVAGGAPCPQAVSDRVRAAGYGFRIGYGLTECGPNCFTISDEEARRHPGAVGRPVPFLEMRLDAGDGREAAPGEPGELLLRGPQLFGGYFGQPGKTAEAMTEDGWFRTGDLAARDEEGRYSICGRRKEMYISGGENVFPGEVEAALMECAGVVEAVVVGMPDAKWGEVGCAFVVTRDGSLLEDAVVAHARSRLAGYKVPRRVVLVAELPRLGSGKVDRTALARAAGEARASAGAR